MNKLMILSAVFSQAVLAVPQANLPISTDGTCGPTVGKQCPVGSCCSQFGSCGGNPFNFDAYCGHKCQVGFGQCYDLKNPPSLDFPVSTDGTCGAIVKKRCSPGNCCSPSGFCGNTEPFCGTGCQKVFGVCSKKSPLKPSKTCIPSKVFAPFLDVTTKTALFNNQNFDLDEARKVTGVKWYSLAFLNGNIEGGKVVPSWGGQFDLDFYKDKVEALRANGGDVVVSFGGLTGVELATLTNSVNEIQAAYQSVIDEYQVRWIDLDIEGENAENKAANDRRSKALVALKAANPGLKISFTLPVLPTGLVKLGLEILQNAKDNKLELDMLNIMAMDYNTVSDGATGMGKHAIEASEATFKQLQAIGFTKTTIGITPMIGNNDIVGEVFTLNNAKELNEYYLKTPFVSFLSMWSGNRDVFVAGGPLFSTSQIPQEKFQFQKLLNQGASDVCVNPIITTTTTAVQTTTTTTASTTTAADKTTSVSDKTTSASDKTTSSSESTTTSASDKTTSASESTTTNASDKTTTKSAEPTNVNATTTTETQPTTVVPPSSTSSAVKTTKSEDTVAPTTVPTKAPVVPYGKPDNKDSAINYLQQNEIKPEYGALSGAEKQNVFVFLVAFALLL
ncbi:hypothetical protein HDV02_006389 [Globomyces sp. JEL0801]|nr:hypothetical protein HDV02_006389 [Globomyces sp. JEL0801]